MLRKISPLLLALPLMLVGCGESSESVANQMLDENHKLVALLNGVTDEASARAAAPEAEAISRRLVELLEKGKNMRDPSKEFQDNFTKEMGKMKAEADKKMMALMTSNPAAGRIIAEAMAGPLKGVKLR